MTDIEWEHARCSCGLDYSYVKGGYKPKTCPSFECVHKYLHPEIYRKEVIEAIKKD